MNITPRCILPVARGILCAATALALATVAAGAATAGIENKCYPADAKSVPNLCICITGTAADWTVTVVTTGIKDADLFMWTLKPAQFDKNVPSIGVENEINPSLSGDGSGPGSVCAAVHGKTGNGRDWRTPSGICVAVPNA